MKKILVCIVALSILLPVSAQVGIGTTDPDPSAILDVNASDKGMLVPRVFLNDVTDTQLDGLNNAAEGLLIYNTNASVVGGSGKGYYTFVGGVWLKLSTSKDNNSWFAVNTNNPPENITDNIYTEGYVGIGQNTPSYTLDIEATEGTRAVNAIISGNTSGPVFGSYIINSNTNNGNHYGTYTLLSGSGGGLQYGSYQHITNSGSNPHYASFNILTGTGTGPQYGSFQEISNSGNGAHTGSYNVLFGTGSGNHFGTYSELYGSGSGAQFGSYHRIVNTGNGSHYGSYSELGGLGNGVHYGNFNKISNSGTAEHYGNFNQLTGWGTGDHYGSVNDLTSSGSGIHYGIYNNLSGDGGGSQYGTNTLIINSGNNEHYGAFNRLIGSGNGIHYGVYNDIRGPGAGDKYGIYSHMLLTAGGTHYGVYSEALKTGSFAGYFKGVVSIEQGDLVVDGTTLVVDESTDNVGIGTTTPTEKLEVNGTIKAVDVNFSGLQTYVDNAEALAAGLTAGDLYKTAEGILRIVY